MASQTASAVCFHKHVGTSSHTCRARYSADQRRTEDQSIVVLLTWDLRHGFVKQDWGMAIYIKSAQNWVISLVHSEFNTYTIGLVI